MDAMLMLLLCAAGFDDVDLRISAMQLKIFLDEAVGSAAGTAGVNVPFDALRYTAGECNYGKFSNGTACSWCTWMRSAAINPHASLRQRNCPMQCPSAVNIH